MVKSIRSLQLERVSQITEELLRREFIENDKSTNTIAREYGVSQVTILKRIQKYGLEKPPQKDIPRQKKGDWGKLDDKPRNKGLYLNCGDTYGV